MSAGVDEEERSEEMTDKSYSAAIFTLAHAVSFYIDLRYTQVQVDALAQRIQKVIEEYIEEVRK